MILVTGITMLKMDRGELSTLNILVSLLKNFKPKLPGASNFSERSREKVRVA